MTAPVRGDETTPESIQMTWPGALKQCLAEHVRFQAAPEAHCCAEREGLGDEERQLQQQEVDILHRMLPPLRSRCFSGSDVCVSAGQV
jgi:hypothetical protein